MRTCHNCGLEKTEKRMNRHKKGAVVIKPFAGVMLCTTCTKAAESEEGDNE